LGSYQFRIEKTKKNNLTYKEDCRLNLSDNQIYLAEFPETLNYPVVRSGSHGEYVRRYFLVSHITYIVILVSSRQIVNVFGNDLAFGIDRQEKCANPCINLTAFQTLQEIIYDC